MAIVKLETETYAILSNVDHTITKLNPTLKKDGYEFVPILLTNLETDFSEVFNISREHKPKQNVTINLARSGINSVSEQFVDALNYYFVLNLIATEEDPPDSSVFLLKRIKPTFSEQGEDYFMSGSTSAEIEIRKYAYQLIRKLRLFKSGQIDFQGYFSILKNDRRVIRKHKTPAIPIYGKYRIEDSDIAVLEKFLSEDLSIPDLLRLAIESFELAYRTTDLKIRFVLLMIGLESIFNRSGNDPIQHIISRHLALTLAESEEDFNELFKATKRLYITRSRIVHGNTDKKELEKINLKINDELQELESLTRRVIMKLLWMYDIESGTPNKDSLFEYLNRKGF